MLVGAAVSLAIIAQTTSSALFAKVAFHSTWMAALAVIVHVVHAALERDPKRRRDGCDDDLDVHTHSDHDDHD